MLKKTICVLSVLCIAIVILAALQRLVTPKYYDGDMAEGGLIASYYDSEKDHDVIFLGDCEVYENFDPAVIEEETGLKTYIRGSAQQLIWQSYYLLEDTLRYETPKAVVFNVLSMKYDEPQNEAYNRLTLDGMEWSGAKIGAINASMTDDESFITYVFPILRYHDRLRDLGEEDFKYFFASPRITTDGSYLRDGVLAGNEQIVAKPLVQDDFGATAWEYMEKMRRLCEANGITLILIKAPSIYPVWYTEWDGRISDYAGAHGLNYINLYNRRGYAGISFETDTYDGGLHLNRTGAQKLSHYFAPILRDAISGDAPCIVDRRDAGDSGMANGRDAGYSEGADGRDAGDSEGADGRDTGDSEGADGRDVGNSGMAAGNDDGSNGENKPRDPAWPDGRGPEDESAEKYAFISGGVDLVPGMKWDKEAPITGEPISYFEAKSCVFEGIDRMYTYAGFEVDVSPDADGGESVTSIWLLDDSVTTPEGAYIGCSREYVEKIYGESTLAQENGLSYEKGGISLEFAFRDDVVVSICYALAE